MSKLSYCAVVAAACVLSFSLHAAERPAVSASSDIFKPLPQPCPVGKTEQVIYDKQGRPVARVCR